MRPIYVAGCLAIAWLAVGWTVVKLRRLPRWTNRDVEWHDTCCYALIIGLDLWTKWPSHFIGQMMTTNLAVGLTPAWTVAIGEWLCHR